LLYFTYNASQSRNVLYQNWAFSCFFGTIGYHWARQLLLLDRVAQVIDATFMGIACLGGALIAVRRRAPSQNPDNSFHEKAGMSQVCFSVFSLFLPVRMFLFFSSSL